MCRRELFNRNSNRDLSIENIDYIELKEIKEEKKYKQYKKHDYVTNAELNRMYKQYIQFFCIIQNKKSFNVNKQKMSDNNRNKLCPC